MDRLIGVVAIMQGIVMLIASRQIAEAANRLLPLVYLPDRLKRYGVRARLVRGAGMLSCAIGAALLLLL